jgi:hypothetical protein
MRMHNLAYRITSIFQFSTKIQAGSSYWLQPFVPSHGTLGTSLAQIIKDFLSKFVLSSISLFWHKMIVFQKWTAFRAALGALVLCSSLFAQVWAQADASALHVEVRGKYGTESVLDIRNALAGFSGMRKQIFLDTPPVVALELDPETSLAELQERFGKFGIIAPISPAQFDAWYDEEVVFTLSLLSQEEIRNYQPRLEGFPTRVSNLNEYRKAIRSWWAKNRTLFAGKI